MILSVATV